MVVVVVVVVVVHGVGSRLLCISIDCQCGDVMRNMLRWFSWRVGMPHTCMHTLRRACLHAGLMLNLRTVLSYCCVGGSFLSDVTARCRRPHQCSLKPSIDEHLCRLTSSTDKSCTRKFGRFLNSDDRLLSLNFCYHAQQRMADSTTSSSFLLFFVSISVTFVLRVPAFRTN